jgi:hypothetical protein
MLMMMPKLQSGYNAIAMVICARKKENAFGECERKWLQRGSNRPGCFSSRGADTSNQQEVPALLKHRVPPVDTLNDTLCEVVVVDIPDFTKKFLDPSE